MFSPAVLARVRLSALAPVLGSASVQSQLGWLAVGQARRFGGGFAASGALEPLGEPAATSNCPMGYWSPTVPIDCEGCAIGTSDGVAVALGRAVGVGMGRNTAVGLGGTVTVAPGQARTTAMETTRAAATPATAPTMRLMRLAMG